MTTLELDVEVSTAEVEVETPAVDASPSVGDVVVVVAVPGAPGGQGPPGDGTPAFGEVPAGAVDGANKLFTTANPFRVATTAVYLNGIREHHYSETTSVTILFSDAPLPGDDIRIDYILQ